MKHKFFFTSALLGLTILLAACATQAVPAVEAPPVEETVEVPEVEIIEAPDEMVTPAVEVSDQEVAGGAVTVPSVSMAVDGWVVIHTTSTEGKPGPVIGYAAAPAGSSSDVQVNIEAEQVTPQLFAMLHIDAGIAGTYEFPGDDVPVKDGEAVVMKPFNLTGLTASVAVSEQELKDGSVMIDSAFQLQSGWVVIHTTSAEGKPGPVVGYAALPAGPSRDIMVKIDSDQMTPQLFAMLHIDAGIAGTYEFPGDDVPVKNGEDVVMVPFNTEESSSQAAQGVKVEIASFAFGPKDLQVSVGTTVTWTNMDGASHTATAGDGSFDSGNLAKGDSFSFTFTKAGTYPYICSYHPNMTGVIMVVP